MIYPTADDWLAATSRRVLLFGMSGVGKTRLASMLRERARWFHYSVDYRIGTRYMGEHIADNFKREAMKVPLLRELLMTDSVHIGSNITFGNLSPLSTYLGKPGDPAKGGLDLAQYAARQDQHREAEVAALLDTPHFIERARDIYGCDDFVCDSGGSICEVVDPGDPDDPVLGTLHACLLPVWIAGTDADREALVARFARAPKPMYYPPDLLARLWNGFLADTGAAPGEVDPDAFLRHGFAALVAHRRPRYARMARAGVTVTAAEVAAVREPDDFVALIARAIARRPG